MADTSRSTGFSLRRWSQRKLAAERGEREAPSVAVTPDTSRKASVPAPPEVTRPVSVAPDAPVSTAAGSTAPATMQTPVALPSIESLTIDSDFAPFMQPGVDENVKRMALRKLLRDPRFNVMDGLDVYIDDYSKPSPIEPALVRTLVQARYIFDPPKTRVTPEGTVEDVPDEALAAAATAPQTQAGPAGAIANPADPALTPPAPASAIPPRTDPAALQTAPASAIPASADPTDAA